MYPGFIFVKTAFLFGSLIFPIFVDSAQKDPNYIFIFCVSCINQFEIPDFLILNIANIYIYLILINNIHFKYKF